MFPPPRRHRSPLVRSPQLGPPRVAATPQGCPILSATPGR